MDLVTKTIDAVLDDQRKLAIDTFNTLSKGERIRVLKHVVKQIHAGNCSHAILITYLLLLKKIYQSPKLTK